MNNIIQHDTKLHDITFSNILNLDEIQKLQDLFADAHGVASLITDINGNPITKPSNFTRLCDTIIRKTQKGCANCYKSDAAIGKYNPLGANSQPCLSGGLWDAGASITVGGKHIANWLIGQVRVEDTDEQELLKYADEIGVDRSEYKAALNEIPIMSVDKFKKIADLLFVIANELSEKAFNILQLRQQIAASNQNQNELKESEYLHRTVLQTAMDGYWMTDLEGKFIAVNEAYCRMSGYTHSELLNMNISDVEVIENKADTDEHIKTVINNRSDRFVSKHRRKDGSVYDVEISAVYNPEYKNAFVVFLRDITEQKQSEITLKESELRFKVLFEDAPDAMLLADPETGKIVDANNTACRLFKKQKNELIGLLQYELHPAQNEDYSKNTFKKHFENTKQNEPIENKIRRSDGTEIPVEIIGQAINLDGKLLMLGTFRDITERKKVEEELKESEEKFAVAFKTSPYAITITRPEDGKFIEVNDAFFSMTGYSPEEALNNSSIGMDLWFDAENRNNVLKVLRVGGAINGQEFQFKKKNGEIITGLFSAQLIDINNNTYILSSINDITEQIIAQEKLRDSEMRFRKILQDVESLSVQGYAPDGTTQYWNKASERLYGYTAEEAIGKKFTDLIIPSEMREGVKQAIIQMAETGQAIPASELTLMRKDGSLVTVFSNHTIVQLAGQPQELFCIDIDLTELKQSEKALRESEERYSSLLQYLETGIVVHAPDSAIITSNPRASELLGLTFEQMQGKVAMDPNWNFVNVDNTNMLVQNYPVQQIINTKQAIKDQIIGIQKTANHTIIWVNVNGFPVLNNDGEITEIVISFNDISERKHAEELFIDIVDKNPMSIQIVNKEGYTLQTNPAFIKLFGSIPPSYYSIFEDLISKGPEFEILIHQTISGEVVHLPDIYYNVHDLMPEAPNNPQWIRALIFPLKDSNGKPERFVVMHENITERKNAEEALRESEEKLNTLFNSMTELVVMHELVFDEKGNAIDYRILDCNKTFTTITGIQKENAVGRLAREVYGTETAPYLQEYANVALNGTTLEFNTFYPPLDKYFLISAVSSEKNKFSTITTDITANEQIHEIIKEKNKELENYIYVASHDLRSPLVNIQGFSKRLQKQTTELTKVVAELNVSTELATEFKKITTDDIPKSLSFILNNVSKMDTLINGLLQVSRTGRVVMSPTILDMNKLFKTIMSIFDYQLKEIEANVILHELDGCFGDANQLNQLFSNIIGNAIKYRDKKRKLTIEISSQMKHHRVVYSIKDNGIGINERHLQKIWDVFYRVDASAAEVGEGLGLSLVKRIVEKHKGRIWAESVEGVGSTFLVELHKNKFEE